MDQNTHFLDPKLKPVAPFDPEENDDFVAPEGEGFNIEESPSGSEDSDVQDNHTDHEGSEDDLEDCSSPHDGALVDKEAGPEPELKPEPEPPNTNDGPAISVNAQRTIDSIADAWNWVLGGISASRRWMHRHGQNLRRRVNELKPRTFQIIAINLLMIIAILMIALISWPSSEPDPVARTQVEKAVAVPKAATSVYIARKDDTWESIALAHGMTVEELRRPNLPLIDKTTDQCEAKKATTSKARKLYLKGKLRDGKTDRTHVWCELVEFDGKLRAIHNLKPGWKITLPDKSLASTAK